MHEHGWAVKWDGVSGMTSRLGDGRRAAIGGLSGVILPPLIEPGINRYLQGHLLAGP
jgi:hypothetical protein